MIKTYQAYTNEIKLTFLCKQQVKLIKDKKQNTSKNGMGHDTMINDSMYSDIAILNIHKSSRINSNT